ncbi:ras-related and estrogen-regulated growth inhibitor-like protein isoform X2 [Lingula anatina]|nr:ras-related and estrogen-regulated growth inhibitor-like protein isoform X2 [Lingula anatina]|eukprot:XP_013392610.1 ras-related and estrogen-regulated growth inhibitor-like protein isoform X2 [Lingula anatina]
MMTGNSQEKGSTKTTYHIVVLGAEGVGKTALVVRYLTRRFLSEYASTEESTYNRTVNVDDKNVQIKITDVIGKSVKQPSYVRSKIQKIDGIVVVYSVTDRRSYEAALNLLDLIRLHARPGTSTPTILVGNKVDLEHIREVDADDAEKDASEYPDCFPMESSAATLPDEAAVIFESLLKKLINKRDSLKVPRRKVSVVLQGSPKLIRTHIKRRLSMFNKSRNGTL